MAVWQRYYASYFREAFEVYLSLPGTCCTSTRGVSTSRDFLSLLIECLLPVSQRGLRQYVSES